MKIMDQAKKKKIKGQTCIDIIQPEDEGWIRLNFKAHDVIVKWNPKELFIYDNK